MSALTFDEIINLPVAAFACWNCGATAWRITNHFTCVACGAGTSDYQALMPITAHNRAIQAWAAEQAHLVAQIESRAQQIERLERQIKAFLADGNP